MNPITRKSVSKLVTQPGFRAVGQTHAEWQAFENPENKRQMYGSDQAWVDWLANQSAWKTLILETLETGFGCTGKLPVPVPVSTSRPLFTP